MGLIRFILLLWLALALNTPVLSATPFEDTMAQRALACTACHGAQGRAGPDGYYPRLAGKPAGYLYNQLVNIRSGRRQYPLMQDLLDTLDDNYLHALAGYFSALALPYPPPAKSTATPRELERGRQLVLQGDKAQGLPACTQCHGLQLTGVNPATPGLLGLPADYLVAQLGGWQTGQRHAAEPDCMAKVAKQLSPADASAVARWLAAQPVPAHAQAADRRPQTPPATPDLHCGSDAAADAPTAATLRPQDADPMAARGAYLARLGNCALCHTQRGGMAYAGGRAIETPFGAVFSSNITPDPVQGIGKWTADDFWRAMHLGVSKDGHALYPAFPYTSYTHLTRADADALFAFLKTVAPAAQRNTRHALRWPFNTALALQGWRALFFTPDNNAAPVVPVQVLPAERADWQRGRYLVQGPGHCLECHGARNALGALSGTPEDPGTGGSVLSDGRWFAPSLSEPGGASVAAWTLADISAFLQTGSNRQAQASGPMAEVVLHGTQYLTDADARAMAVYLKALPQRVALPTTTGEQKARASHTVLAQGARLYTTHCADCHGEQGQGRAGAYPALAGNRTAVQAPPNNLVNSVLAGGFAPATQGQPHPFGMPPFALRLSDAELAAVLSHIRSSWGNQAPALSEFDINMFRRTRAP